MYGSTSFERPHAHNQELKNCSSSLWFYRGGVVVTVLLVVVGPAGRPTGPTTTNNTCSVVNKLHFLGKQTLQLEF
jgi:hypothetical protein